MKSRFGRIINAAIIAEILAVAVLVAIVAALGPREPEAAQAYAEQLGVWVGPIAGFLFCLLAGWWVAKGLASSHLLNGLLLGIAAATVDVALLVLSGAEFEWIFVLSNVGRVLAGTLGGWIASRRQPEPTTS